MNTEFEIVVRNSDFSSISIIGDVDIQTSEYLNNFFKSNIDKCVADMVIDCEKLTYIDSIGISILMRVLIKMKQKNLDIYLVKMNKNVKKLFEITGLDSAFKLAMQVFI